MHEKLKLEWKEFKETTKKKRDDKLMELYPYIIADNTEDNIKRRKKHPRKYLNHNTDKILLNYYHIK